jgi:glycosyltransferase involved in cell wall biosynthesis
MPPIRIAHVALSLPVGGTERLVEHMIRNPAPGTEVECICLDQEGAIGQGLRQAGYSIRALNRRPGLDLTLAFRLAQISRARHYDILHCHQYTPWFYGMLARLFRPSLKILLTEHGRFHPDLPSPKRRFFNKLAAPRSHGLIAVSPATREALIRVEDFPPAQVSVVFNGVVPQNPGFDRAEARRRLNLDPDGIYFILCARFDPIKWIHGLVEAFALMAPRHAKARLLLVGDGPERASIEAAVARLGLTDKVVFPGFRNDVATWLRAADAFVLCSHSEGTSVSLIEAMSMGLPALVTKVGGNPFVVAKDETALVVPPADVPSLSQAMERLAGDEELRNKLGSAGSMRYEQLFRLEKMLAGYADIYTRIATGVKWVA